MVAVGEVERERCIEVAAVVEGTEVAGTADALEPVHGSRYSHGSEAQRTKLECSDSSIALG